MRTIASTADKQFLAPEVIAAANITIGNKSFKTMGVSIPIIEAMKPNIWIAGAISPSEYISANSSITNLGNFHFDSGISLGINLADIAPESRLLWMFKNEVSLTAYVPLVSYIPEIGRAHV